MFELEKYCRGKKLPFIILLIVHSAPGHPAYAHDFHSNVKVVFVPLNTTLIHPPVEWGIIIASFKSYYLRRIFVV
jgi:proteasome lid subunit RPN8/RPN11